MIGTRGRRARISKLIGGAVFAFVVSVTTSIASASSIPSDVTRSQVGVTTAAAAVAKTSRSQVTELHDLAVSAGHTKGLPPSLIPAAARGVSASLRSELSTAKSLHQRPATPTGKLVTSLTSYVTLATRLAAWNFKAAKRVAASYFASLRKTDASWRSALSLLGRSTHTNLLAGMPTLLFPKS